MVYFNNFSSAIDQPLHTKKKKIFQIITITIIIIHITPNIKMSIEMISRSAHSLLTNILYGLGKICRCHYIAGCGGGGGCWYCCLFICLHFIFPATQIYLFREEKRKKKKKYIYDYLPIRLFGFDDRSRLSIV